MTKVRAIFVGKRGGDLVVFNLFHLVKHWMISRYAVKPCSFRMVSNIF